MSPTVISVTPLSLVHDSRTYRAALSFKRFGWNSVVVEGEPSVNAPEGLPFSLIGLSGKGDGGGAASEPGKNALRRLLPGAVWECGTFVWFVFQVFIVNVARGFARVPKADLYYLHEYRLFPMVYLLAKRSGAKIVYDAHDFYPGVHADADLTPFWRHVFRPFLVWLEGLCVHRVDGMLTVNKGIADLYKDIFGAAAQVTRNCHDEEMDVPVERGLRETLGVSDEDFLLVTVGNRKPGQHVGPALDAVAALPPDVHLAFVGRGYGQLAEDISARGLAGRVHIVSPIPANRVVPFIRSADAALILYYARSRNDAHFLPNGFFQGIAARLPVLYPELQWIKEMGDAFGIGEEIDPAEADEISAGVDRLRKRIAADSMGDALDNAAREISWRTEERVLKEMTERVLGTGNDA